MSPHLLLSALLTANPYLGRDADVVVTRVVPANPATVYGYLLDIKHQEALWPPDCASRWEFGRVTRGPGAMADLRYEAARWHRNLTMVLSKVSENQRIELEHPGRKGFITTWTFTERESFSDVELHTWVNAPPWPLRKYFYEKVQPAWRDCHGRTLENLEKAMRANGPSSQVEP